jgi:hypothetical protein
VDNRQAEELFEGVEVAVTVQERMPLGQAEAGDETVDRFPHCSSLLAKSPKVLRRGPRQVDAAQGEDVELRKLPVDGRSRRFVGHALQHFAKNDVRQGEGLKTKLGIHPVRMRVFHAAQVIDPDRRVDDDDGRLLRDAALARSIQVAFPRHLSPQLPHAALAARLNQQTQTLLDRRALGWRAAAAHGLIHQVVIDVDVGAHG